MIIVDDNHGPFIFFVGIICVLTLDEPITSLQPGGLSRYCIDICDSFFISFTGFYFMKTMRAKVDLTIKNSFVNIDSMLCIEEA